MMASTKLAPGSGSLLSVSLFHLFVFVSNHRLRCLIHYIFHSPHDIILPHYYSNVPPPHYIILTPPPRMYLEAARTAVTGPGSVPHDIEFWDALKDDVEVGEGGGG